MKRARRTPQAPGLPAVARLSARIGLFERDLVTGRGHWDDGVYAIFGLDPQVDVPSFEGALALVHPDDRGRFAAYHERMVASDAARADVRFRICRPDGSVRWLQSIADVTHDAGGRALHMRGVLIDETEAMAEAHAERERSAKLERTLELADVEAWRIDLATERIHFNRAGYRNAHLEPLRDGLPLADIRGAIHPDDLAAVVAAAEQALHGDGSIDLIARYADTQGGWRTLLTRRVAERDAGGRAVALLGVSLDLTELVAERQRAARLAERLNVIADAAGIGIWSRDVDTGRSEWNAPMMALYGLDPSAASPDLDTYLERFLHPQDRARFEAEVRRADGDGEPVKHLEFRIRTADGRERWIYSWARRETRDGRRVAFGVNVDVTDRHVAEVERRERERAEQSRRAQSEFLARVSHELRTPMNAVLGFADLLAADPQRTLDPVQAQRVERIRAAGRHLLSLIDDMLDLAAIDADRREPHFASVPLKAVVAQVLPWVSMLAQQRGVEVAAPAPCRGTVRADGRWIAQVASNLLTNAVKYNRPGGWVRIETRRRTRDGTAQWALVVRDSGRGLSDSQRRRLFEPFERLGADREGIQGSGIGLSIVRRLVQRMGGDIEVASEPGVGAEFRVWLPAAAASDDTWAGAPPSARAAVTAPGAAARLEVLCVEDNEVNLALVAELLALRPQVRLRTAADGHRGIEQALASPPDVLLLDIHLPDIDGFEVLRRLRAEPALAGCAFIGLSANAMPADVRHALDKGFDDYWTKPIDFTRFLAAIDGFIGRRAAGAAAA